MVISAGIECARFVYSTVMPLHTNVNHIPVLYFFTRTFLPQGPGRVYGLRHDSKVYNSNTRTSHAHSCHARSQYIMVGTYGQGSTVKHGDIPY